MKLLINLCAQDGIVSHNSGVGTIVKRYIELFDEILLSKKIDYHLNLFTPEYNKDGFGYSQDTFDRNKNKRHTIKMFSNGTNGNKFFGNIANWKIISKKIAYEINNIEFDKYDKVITILNDCTFNNLLYLVPSRDNHIKILIPHSTALLYGLDKETDKNTKERFLWEQDAFNFINNNENCYVGATGNFVKHHLIDEYKCRKDKIINLINGEILEKVTKYEENDEMVKLFSDIKDNKEIIMSFGRPEEYKNLTATMDLGKELNIRTIILTQEYFEGMEIIDKYKYKAKKTNSLLYINAPFAYPFYVLKHFMGTIILVIPSKKETVGLIINEVRKLNKDNVLIVANNIQSFADQIDDKKDGLLVEVDNYKESALKIREFLNKDSINVMNKNSQKRLKMNFNLRKNIEEFLKEILGDMYE